MLLASFYFSLDSYQCVKFNLILKTKKNKLGWSCLWEGTGNWNGNSCLVQSDRPLWSEMTLDRKWDRKKLSNQSKDSKVYFLLSYTTWLWAVLPFSSGEWSSLPKSAIDQSELFISCNCWIVVADFWIFRRILDLEFKDIWTVPKKEVYEVFTKGVGF